MKLLLTFISIFLQIFSFAELKENVPTEIIHAPQFEDVFDIRIHEGAESGTRLIMSSELRNETRKLTYCFGQLDTDVNWIEYSTPKSAFYTTEAMPLSATKNSNHLGGTLHLLCPGNSMHIFEFRVHITHRNHHPPEFQKPFYLFYVPLNLQIGGIVGKIEVFDLDPVIYNSDFNLEFTNNPNNEYVNIEKDGTLKLAKDVSIIHPYTPIRLELLAIDFGSPQMYSRVNVTLLPVTVSAVRNPRVNVATEEYQIFEWEPPEYGQVHKYRLSIKKEDQEQTIYEEELEATRNVALTKIKLDPYTNITYQIAAIDSNGATLTDWLFLGTIDKGIECDGDCSKGGGVPLCYFGAFNRIEQFVDSRGAHCLCFPGFIGVSCDGIDKCRAERTIDVFGGINWKEVNSNTTLRLPCPYNSPAENQSIERSCKWDEESGRAVWKKAKENDRCTHQSSVLTHLGMIGTFSAKATHVSAVNTVTSFIRKLVMVPSFSVSEPAKYADFDQKIAEMAALVLDSVIKTNLDVLAGNTTVLREETWNVIDSFSRTLPIPYALESPDHGIHIKAIEWNRKADLNDNMIGKNCRLQLPTIDSYHTVRAICTSNATLFELLDPKTPVLSVKPENRDDFTFTRMTIMIRSPDNYDNYTCVYYDEEEKAWSTKGIRRIDHNYLGYVKCETNHFGVFSILPDRMFFNSESFWKDLSSHMPTVTSFVTLICTVLLLFMAAVQKNQPIDCAFLFYLFFIFMIHLIHLLLFLAPQVGEPFAFSTTLLFILQFCIIASAGLLSLVLYSIHTTIINYDVTKNDEDSNVTCFSRPFHVFAMGIVLPFLFTFSTHYFTDGRDIDISRLVEKIDWLFISNYLLPTAIFFSISIVYAVWNVYIASGTKNNRRCTSDRVLALSPAISASLTALFMIFFLCSKILLFFFREQSTIVVLLFCVFQSFHMVTAFFFASYLFRLRFLLQRTSANGANYSCSGESTDSLERKRDISRALLEHVDTKSDIASDRCVIDGGFTEAGFAPHSNNNYQYTPPSSTNEYTHDISGGRYLSMNHNIFERAPMVSIV
ncbi:unnamed protein product [Caenorhabditis angaria]|uniref:Fibronectin type-III domain-containing protein n=1 Tax=Caenorhabditis angaria TaxID=860376 RepID=A0A9P1IPJ9_9PELO|nr:unnamed protein product [Caenorhabditis angaria]